MPKFQIETRQVCDTCGQLLGGFHKQCEGTWVGQRRGVTPWETVAAGSYSANCLCVDEHGANCPEFGYPSAQPPPDTSWLEHECPCCHLPEHVSWWRRLAEWMRGQS